jgi:hypothetical protein
MKEGNMKEGEERPCGIRVWAMMRFVIRASDRRLTITKTKVEFLHLSQARGPVQGLRISILLAKVFEGLSF